MTTPSMTNSDGTTSVDKLLEMAAQNGQTPQAARPAPKPKLGVDDTNKMIEAVVENFTKNFKRRNPNTSDADVETYRKEQEKLGKAAMARNAAKGGATSTLGGGSERRPDVTFEDCIPYLKGKDTSFDPSTYKGCEKFAFALANKVSTDGMSADAARDGYHEYAKTGSGYGAGKWTVADHDKLFDGILARVLAGGHTGRPLTLASVIKVATDNGMPAQVKLAPVVAPTHAPMTSKEIEQSLREHDRELNAAGEETDPDSEAEFLDTSSTTTATPTTTASSWGMSAATPTAGSTLTQAERDAALRKAEVQKAHVNAYPFQVADKFSGRLIDTKANVGHFLKMKGITLGFDPTLNRHRINGLKGFDYLDDVALKALRAEARENGLKGDRFEFDDIIAVLANEAKTAALAGAMSRRKIPASVPLKLDDNYLLEDIILVGEHSLLYGPPNSGKTVAATDFAHHVARGQPWCGNATLKMPVLLVPYEGVRGLDRRLTALDAKYGSPGPWLQVMVNPPSLANSDSQMIGVGIIIEEAKAVMQDCGADAILIIIDTKSAATPGNDENSATDTVEFLSRLKHIAKAVNGTTLTVHHSGKDVTNGARGSSAQLGNFDDVLWVAHKKGESVRTIGADKLREGVADKVSHTFEIEGFKLGTNKKGKDVFAPVIKTGSAKAVVAAAVSTSTSAATQATTPQGPVLNKYEAKVLEEIIVFMRTGGSAGGPVVTAGIPGDQNHPDIRGVDGDELRDAHIANATSRDKRENARRYLRAAIQSLTDKKVITTKGTFIIPAAPGLDPRGMSAYSPLHMKIAEYERTVSGLHQDAARAAKANKKTKAQVNAEAKMHAKLMAAATATEVETTEEDAQ